MKMVYLIRHGETDTSNAGRYQWPSEPLNAKGLEQAQVVARRAKNLDAELIITSTSKRAVQTAQIVAETTGLPIEESALFVERVYPSEMMEKSRKDPEVVAIKKHLIDNEQDPEWHYADEENFYDAQRRSKQAIQLLEERSEEKILVITHEITKKLITTTMARPDMMPDEFRRWSTFFVGNKTGITVCNLDPEKGWRMRTWNDHAHLG